MFRAVLVVDDDSTFHAIAGRVLEEAGVEVVLAAADAAAGLDQALAKRPDAMLVDVGLPDRDGIALGRELAELPWGPRVVLTSADRDAGRGLDGALSFVPKEALASGVVRELLAAE